MCVSPCGCKVILMLVVAVVVLRTVTNAKSIDGTSKDVKDDVQEAIDNMTLVLNEAQNGSVTLRKNWQSFDEQAKALMDATETEIAERLVGLTQIVDDFQKKAEEQGVYIGECTTTWNTTMEKAIKATLDLVNGSLQKYSYIHYTIWGHIAESVFVSKKKLEEIAAAASLCDNDKCLEHALGRLQEYEDVPDKLLVMIHSELAEFAIGSKLELENAFAKIELLYSHMTQRTEIFVLCATDKLD